jgi:O-antigen ligase
MNRLWFSLLLALTGFIVSLRAQGTTSDADLIIKACPSRISLGALSYGSNEDRIFNKRLTLLGVPENIRVTNVDLSHAAGIEVVSQKRIPNGIEISLAVSEKRFTDQQPYGKFVKKVMRLETNSTVQPQFVIPVIGWLAMNETERNFNHFLFDGSKRWQGIWGTPNIAGAMLSGVIVFLIGSCMWLKTFRKIAWLRYGIISILAITALIAMVCLAFTYSRGSWVAFMAGVLTLTLMSGSLRKIAIGTLIGFIIIICFLPSGLKRMESYTQIETDKSIAHRLKLWTGAAQMMAEYPLRGVGQDQFGPVFSRDYQTFEHVTDNSTAVSDYFTLGAERGYVFVSIVTGLSGFLLWYSWREACRHRSIPQLTLAAMLVTVLVSSAFSTLAFVFHYQCLFALAVLGLLGFMGVAFYEKPVKSQFGKMLFLQGLFGIVGGCLVFGIGALISLRLLPTKTSMDKVLSCHVVQPRWMDAKGTIIYLADEKEDGSVLCHTTLRPLAALGWNVVWSDKVVSSAQVLALAQKCQRQFPRSKLYLAGNSDGGKLAWRTLQSLPDDALFAKAAGYSFLDGSLLKESQPLRQPIPFLLYQSLYDDHCSANPAILIHEGKIQGQGPITVILSDQEPARFSAGWQQWLIAIDQYFTDFDKR